MTDALATINPEDAALAAEAATTGDLSKLSPDKRASLYGAVCRSMGLNPLTQPFLYVMLNGKLTLYAARGATDQLRKINGVTVDSVKVEEMDGVLTVTVQAHDHTGRSDIEIGSVFIAGLKGEALANAHMKAVTKAKRRLTLSICGLGWLDETEVHTIPGAIMPNVNTMTGEIVEPTPISANSNRVILPNDPSVSGHPGAMIDIQEMQDDETQMKRVNKQIIDLVNGVHGWSKVQLNAVSYHLLGIKLGDLTLEGLVELHDFLKDVSDESFDQIKGGADVTDVFVLEEQATLV